MFFDAQTDCVIGSLGWVDGPCIWQYAVAERRSRLVPISSAKFVALRRFGNLLRIIHHGGIEPTVSLRRLTNIDEEAARVQFGQAALFTGDDDLWGQVDTCVLVSRKTEKALLLFDAKSKSVQELDLSWFYHGDYDLGYQTVLDCLALPDGQHVAVSLQHSSRLALLSIRENRKVGEIGLVGNVRGNPQIALRDDETLIANNYDVLCLVDLKRMATTASAHLQGGTVDGVAQFIGDFAVQPEGIVLARPFSGDVMLLDRNDLSANAEASTGQQPLQAVVVPGSRVLARDWKTGNVLEGTLEVPSKR